VSLFGIALLFGRVLLVRPGLFCTSDDKYFETYNLAERALAPIENTVWR
jgi:hypothetical protein